ncbi:IS110 family transposase [Haloechinothrix halophila]|uniref:IS110 family transposase n=1 Tax=Haloechinothrix halophila TaxID=1069073 RepID=UPI000425D86D|nr:transposase [Haloechinothrix halophila]
MNETLHFVGIDWAAVEHAVCIMDVTGKIVSQIMIKPSADGIAVLVRRLAELGDPADIPIAIERPNGRLVDLLLEPGHPVVPVNPNAIKTWRDGEVFSGAKSDAGNAAMIAEYLHLRQHRLRTVTGTTDEALTEALRDAVLAVASVLTALGTAIKDLDRSTVAHLGERPDGKILTSLPRSSQINAAQMLAGWDDCRQAYECPDSVAALAGCTAVPNQSGKHRAVHFRWACNKHFRRAMTSFADNSRHANPWAAKIYRDAIADGKDHPHAVRVLVRAWIRVIWRCWLDSTSYAPTKHGALRRQITPTAA